MRDLGPIVRVTVSVMRHLRHNCSVRDPVASQPVGDKTKRFLALAFQKVFAPGTTGDDKGFSALVNVAYVPLEQWSKLNAELVEAFGKDCRTVALL